jgi:hypothetical protein
MRELFHVAAIFLSGEGGRELPASPIFFGLFFFGALMLLLYLTLRIDRD